MSKKLLIVDDDQTTCLLVASGLKGDEFSVQSACTYNDAVIALRSEHFDLVLLDIHLDIVDGIEMTGFDVIRDTDPFPFAVLTSTSDPNLVRESETVHSLGYLVKPIDRLHLKTQVNIILSVAEERAKQIQALQTLRYVNIAIGLVAGMTGMGVEDAHNTIRQYCRSKRIKMADFCEAELSPDCSHPFEEMLASLSAS